MSYYTTCPHCGANLDPGEICECRNWSDTRKEILKIIMKLPNDSIEYVIDRMEEHLEIKIRKETYK